MPGLKVIASELLATVEPSGAVRTNQLLVTVDAKLESTYAVLQSLYCNVCRTVPVVDKVETDAAKGLPRQNIEFVNARGPKDMLAGMMQVKNWFVR